MGHIGQLDGCALSVAHIGQANRSGGLPWAEQLQRIRHGKFVFVPQDGVSLFVTPLHHGTHIPVTNIRAVSHMLGIWIAEIEPGEIFPVAHLPHFLQQLL